MSGEETQRREGAPRFAKPVPKVRVPDEVEAFASAAVDAALAVHRVLGPGLLESAYRDCMAIELAARGHQVEREVLFPIRYRGQTVDRAFRADLLIDGKLLIQLKAVEALQSVHRVQFNTYLRLLHLPLGLLINFHVPLIKDGTHRVLNLSFRSEPVAA
jgi:GxxExxY protein